MRRVHRPILSSATILLTASFALCENTQANPKDEILLKAARNLKRGVRNLSSVQEHKVNHHYKRQAKPDTPFMFTEKERDALIELAKRNCIPTLKALDEEPVLKQSEYSLSHAAIAILGHGEWIQSLLKNNHSQEDIKSRAKSHYNIERVMNFSGWWLGGLSVLNKNNFKPNPKQKSSIKNIEKLLEEAQKITELKV